MSCSSLIHGDCLYMMPDLMQDSVDAIVTDPPYGLTGDGKGGFMGKEWDGCVPGVKFWKQAIRVAKPGAWLLAFGGTRTYHRLACAIEDAGWEIRDCIMWVFGGGWPKSLNIAKAIDRHNGYEGRVVGTRKVDTSMQGGNLLRGDHRRHDVEQEVRELSPDASKWEGFGTCLKPAYEPILVARKPLDGTVINNVLKHGTGALNIDACRVPLPDGDNLTDGIERNEHKADTKGMGYNFVSKNRPAGVGRFPANLIHDGSPEVLELFPESRGQQGAVTGKEPSETTRGIYGKFSGNRKKSCPRGDSGSAARFFYCAKASRSERNKGCERTLQWELDQGLILLLEKSNKIIVDISESMMQNLGDIACSTTSYGNSITDRYQKECMSTILTALRLITELRTSLLSHPLSINDVILDAIRTSEECGINVVQLAEKLSLLRQDSIKGKMAIAINAVNALFSVLSEIRSCAKQGNQHITVKPLALMRYLVTLVAPPGSVVMDPFMGSGTTGVACMQTGHGFIGIEKEKEYFEIAKKRISEAKHDREGSFSAR